MIHERVPLSCPDEWHSALHGIPHAFAHTWQYCRAMHFATSRPTWLHHATDGSARCVCPLAERSFRGERDLVTPYGFSGFTATTPMPDLLPAFAEHAARCGYVCGYIAMHPAFAATLLTDCADLFAGATVYLLDLSRSADALLSNLSASHRRRLRRQEGELVDERDPAVRAFFLDEYPAFMTRKEAGPTYALGRRALETLLDGPDVLLLGAARAGRIEAVALFGWTPYVADFLFGVSLPGGEGHSVRLIWAAALELKRRGVPTMNLGGGIRPGDGVEEFKRRFGGTAVPSPRVQQVYDAVRYNALCEAAGVPTERGIGYFPPYHRPAAI